MKFSVIIPLFNKAQYVTETLQSIFAQTFTDWELIVIDDGSTDDSLQVATSVIEDAKKSFPIGKLKLISQSNAGVSTARNNGVAASQGEYICFLDADDWWETTFLEEIDRLINDFPEAGIYGTNYAIINETRHKTRVAPVGLEDGFERGYINYCAVYAKTLCMPLTSISVAIPRRVFDEMQGFKPYLKLGEDFELWIRVALKYKVAFLNKSLANYNQDVDVACRGIGHLYPPENHMLWNLDFLNDEERTNADYKLLIDKLRTNGLQSFYLSKWYHEAAKQELAKVDWSRQSTYFQSFYNRPLWLLRINRWIIKLCYQVKMMVFHGLKFFK